MAFFREKKEIPKFADLPELALLAQSARLPLTALERRRTGTKAAELEEEYIKLERQVSRYRTRSAGARLRDPALPAGAHSWISLYRSPNLAVTLRSTSSRNSGRLAYDTPAASASDGLIRWV